MKLKPFPYEKLNARQKENYNFQKLSAVLAEYGYATLRLSDDWNGADFIALHINGKSIRVQLKGRLTFCKKYQGGDLYVAFCSDRAWYMFPHDKLLKQFLKHTKIGDSASWKTEHGQYSFPHLSDDARRLLKPYRLRENFVGQCQTCMNKKTS